MAQRLRFEVRRVGRYWRMFREGEDEILWSWSLKATTVDLAARVLRDAWNHLRIRSELVIKRADGTIQDTRTYGDDPRRTKG